MNPVPVEVKAIVLRPAGAADAPFDCALAVFLPSMLKPLRSPLDDTQALTCLRRYQGAAGAEGASEELVSYCAKAVTQYRARIEWLLWGDGSNAIIIRTSTCPPLNAGALRRCYAGARAEAERVSG